MSGYPWLGQVTWCLLRLRRVRPGYDRLC